MDYIAIAVVGFFSGAAVTYFALDKIRRKTAESQRLQDAEADQIAQNRQALDAERKQLANEAARIAQALDAERKQLTDEAARIAKASADSQALADQIGKR